MVVAFISILSTLVTVFVTGNIAKSNDAKRKSDIDRITIAIEEYEKDNNCYPKADSMQSCGSGSNIAIHPYLSNVPCDPQTKNSYGYEVGPESSSCGSWYRVYAKLQNTSDSQIASGIGPDSGYNFYKGSENAPIPVGVIASNPNSSPESTPSDRQQYWVEPYIVYPADKPMYPKYAISVSQYMVELQNWYKEKLGKTFYMKPLVVVRSSYTYDIMRCDPSPFDSTPPSQDCLNDPKQLIGNWPMYMNLAIHNGVEKWDEHDITLVFSAGGGGWAGGSHFGDTGYAVVGDWVLEPISGVPNEWGIPCKYSDGWQCSGGVPKGTPAHELGHAFGLSHPDAANFDSTIMGWHGNYPTVGFLPSEVDYLLASPYFDE